MRLLIQHIGIQDLTHRDLPVLLSGLRVECLALGIPRDIGAGIHELPEADLDPETPVETARQIDLCNGL